MTVCSILLQPVVYASLVDAFENQKLLKRPSMETNRFVNTHAVVLLSTSRDRTV